MSNFLKNFDLTCDSLDIFLIMNLLFLQNLDCDLNNNCQISKSQFGCTAICCGYMKIEILLYLFTGEDVCALFDLTKCSFSERFAYNDNKLTTIYNFRARISFG